MVLRIRVSDKLANILEEHKDVREGIDSCAYSLNSAKSDIEAGNFPELLHDMRMAGMRMVWTMNTCSTLKPEEKATECSKEVEDYVIDETQKLGRIIDERWKIVRLEE